MDIFDFDPSEKAKELREKLSYHQKKYDDGCPEISDTEFDMIKKELQELELQYPGVVVSDSPTQKIATVIDAFTSKPHLTPMLSLANTYNKEDISNWIQKCKTKTSKQFHGYIIEDKIDGLSGSLRYNGNLNVALTRGDGKSGDDVTHNAKATRTIPTSLPMTKDIEIRGEFYIPKKMLEKINAENEASGKKIFKNCRNLAVGTLKSLNSAVVSERGLSFIAYSIVNPEQHGITTEIDLLNFLQNLGFLTIDRRCASTVEEVEMFLKEMDESRKSHPYDVDGAVIKINSIEAQKECGQSEVEPNWAVAFKFKQETAFTTLLRVDWQVGRHQISPVGILEPAELEGTTVKRASLHNIKQISEKDIRVGDTVEIEKAAFIIPYVIRSVPEKRNGSEIPIEYPKECPSCGAKTLLNAEGTELCCSNSECGDVKFRRILHFVQVMDIESVGPGLIKKLLDEDLVNIPTDLYKLTMDDLMKLDRMGTSSATKVFNNILSKNSASPAQKIMALGIAEVGKASSKAFEEKFKNFEKFLSASDVELQSISGIGPSIIRNIREYLSNNDNDLYINTLKNMPEAIVENKLLSNKLSGYTICLTGEATKPRDELSRMIIAHGGAVSGGVNKKTTHLIIGSKEEPSYTSNKKTNAQKFNLPILNEFDLFKMIGEE